MKQYSVVSRDSNGVELERAGFFQTPEVADGVRRIWERMGAEHVEVVTFEDPIDQMNTQDNYIH